MRVWTPGCSTGEEVYSVLMLIREVLEKLNRNIEVNLFATDIDDDALRIARKGVYSEAGMADIEPFMIRKYFNIRDNQFEVKKILRSDIIFSHHNILSDPPFKNIDLIVCRNLLIYFNTTAQKHVMPLFYYALKMGGLLFLGKSENSTNYEHMFATVDKKFKIYKQIPSAKTEQSFMITPLKENVTKRTREKDSRSAHRLSLQDTILKESVNFISPNLVVTNEQIELIYKKGNPSFLTIPDGYTSYNLFKMVNPQLSLELRTAVTGAKKTGQRTETRFVPVSTETGNRLFIKATVMLLNENPPELYAFFFQEIHENDLPISTIPGESGEESYNLALELELKHTREHMQTLVEELETSNEELQSTNEELQSSNEELQSTNEELETSNEELQSINEELQTAYAELKETYHEIHQIKDQFHSLNQRYESLIDNVNDVIVASTIEGMIISVNKSMESISGWKRSSLITRPWKDLSIDYTEDLLERQKTDLFQNGIFGPIDIKLVTRLGEMKVLRMMNYLTRDRDGTVQVWSFGKEITEEFTALQKLSQSEKKYKVIFETAGVGLAQVALNGKFLHVNKKLSDLLGYTMETMLMKTHEEVTHPADKEADQTVIRMLLEGKQDVYNLQKRYIQKDGNEVLTNLSYSLVRDTEMNPDFFVAVVEVVPQ